MHHAEASARHARRRRAAGKFEASSKFSTQVLWPCLSAQANIVIFIFRACKWVKTARLEVIIITFLVSHFEIFDKVMNSWNWKVALVYINFKWASRTCSGSQTFHLKFHIEKFVTKQKARRYRVVRWITYLVAPNIFQLSRYYWYPWEVLFLYSMYFDCFR